MAREGCQKWFSSVVQMESCSNSQATEATEVVVLEEDDIAARTTDDLASFLVKWVFLERVLCVAFIF